MRLGTVLQNKNGQICFDQIRCIDKMRLKTKIAALGKSDIEKVKNLLKEYLVN
jgi:mRNA-degrading endonuclease toxin of MazEF toxin-antitoxin module